MTVNLPKPSKLRKILFSLPHAMNLNTLHSQVTLMDNLKQSTARSLRSSCFWVFLKSCKHHKPFPSCFHFCYFFFQSKWVTSPLPTIQYKLRNDASCWGIRLDCAPPTSQWRIHAVFYRLCACLSVIFCQLLWCSLQYSAVTQLMEACNGQCNKLALFQTASVQGRVPYLLFLETPLKRHAKS